MTEHDFETLSRYLDGELPAAERENFEHRLESETELRDTLEHLRRIDSQLRALKHAPGAGNVPPRVTALLASDTPSKIKPFASPRGRAATGLAIAASLVAAAGLLTALQWQAPDDSLHPADASRPALARVLERTPSSASEWITLDTGSQLRPVLSFAANDGQWCREYQFSTDESEWRGIACRGEQTWHTRVLVGDSGNKMRADDYYQPAGAHDHDAIAHYIDEHARDIPLSAREEAALIDSHWR